MGARVALAVAVLTEAGVSLVDVRAAFAVAKAALGQVVLAETATAAAREAIMPAPTARGAIIPMATVRAAIIPVATVLMAR